MEGWNKILSIVERAKSLGSRTLSNGNQLIGHVPHVAPEAWFHQIFAPLDNKGVDLIETKIKRPMPFVLRDFLKTTNGLKIFSCSLSIYGLRVNYSRVGDASWQPFDIELPNIIERIKDSESSYVFIGGYNWDGSQLYIDSKTSKVFRSEQGSSGPINEWNSFEEMLITETIRIGLLFDEKGRKIDPKEPTIPN